MRAYLCVAALGIVLSGCSGPAAERSVTTTSTGQVNQAVSGITAAQGNFALVRFLNANPIQMTATVAHGDRTLFPNVAFKTVTPYTEVPRGYTQFRLNPDPSGKESAASRRELFPGRHYTIVSLPNRDGKARLVTFSDNLGNVEPGLARIRLINATADVENVDLYQAGVGVRLARGVDPGEFTTFTDVRPSPVELRSSAKAPPMHLSMLPIVEGRLYTYVVVGGNDHFDVVTIDDRLSADDAL